MSTTKLINVKSLADRLSVSKRQVFRLNSAGKLPHPLRIGASVRWSEESIEQWIDMGCPDRQEFEARQREGAAHA